jgi:glycosyltransferase involved in cell wall biosynthesis
MAQVSAASPKSAVRTHAPQVAKIDVSIVVPCFNHGLYLGEALASARACPAPRSEVIVVNDGSDDPVTVAVLDELRRDGTRVIDQPNLGPAAARNAGIAASRGRYILPLDADNRLRPRYPLVGAQVLDRNPEVGIVYGDSGLFGEQAGLRRPGPFDLSRLLRGNYIDTCAVFRREIWEDAGGYQTATELWEDWDFWLTAAERGYGFHYVPEVLFDYRIRADAPSSQRNSAVWRAQRKVIVTRHPALFNGGRRGLRHYVAARDPAFYGRVTDWKQAVQGWLRSRLRGVPGGYGS